MTIVSCSNLVGNNFMCDCCLEWLVECNYSAVILDMEYCANPQDFGSNVTNMRITDLTPEDICPTCRKW